MKVLKNAFLKVMSIVSKVELLVAEILLAALIIVTIIGTLTRYFLGHPFTWMEEFQLACVVWIVFAAAAVAFHEKAHVAIEMVVDLFPKKVQDVINVLIGIVVLLTLGYLFKTSSAYIEVFIRSGRTTPILELPYSVIYGIVPVSCILMMLEYFHGLLDPPQDNEEEEEIPV